MFTFTPQDLENSQKLLQQLYETVTAEEGALSGGRKLGLGGKTLESLRQTSISFGNPRNELIRLTPKLFDDIGVELSEIQRRQRSQYDFYYMTLSVSMQPGRGTYFSRVECSLDLGPKGEKEPIVHAIFPTSAWREVLSYGGGLKLGLDGDLNWRVGLPEGTELSGDLGSVAAQLANINELKSFIVVPDYEYQLGRAEIAATGEGNSKCFWRIDKPELQQVQTVSFGVIFKVLKGVQQLEMLGMVAVEPDMAWLTAGVRDVFDAFGYKLQSLFRKSADQRQGAERLPIGDFERWQLDLPV